MRFCTADSVDVSFCPVMRCLSIMTCIPSGSVALYVPPLSLIQSSTINGRLEKSAERADSNTEGPVKL